MHRRSLRLRCAGAWALCAGWMSFIFLMSAMPGDVSGAQSGTVVRILLALLDALPGRIELSANALSRLELLGRKAAHMTEYAILFFLLSFSLRQSGARRIHLKALLLCACYAATDEWHQSFVGGRGPSIVDVGIDTLGAALALCVQALAAHVWKRRKRT